MVAKKELTVDQMFISQLTAEAQEYIFDTAKEEVRDAITNTENSAEAIGATTYKVTKGLLDKYKKVGISLEADMSHALALGTEITDMLVETVQAMQPEAILNPDKLREEALMRATVMHGEDIEKLDDPEAKEEAQVMYANMMDDGTVDQAMGYVNSRSADLGLNTNDMMRTGVEQGTKFAQDTMAAKDPLAEGIAKGLHNMSTPGQAAPPAPDDPTAQPQMGEPQMAAADPMAPPPADPMAVDPAAPPVDAPLMGAV